MNRRAALFGSGSAIAGAIATRARAEGLASGSYDINLGVLPGKKPGEFTCKVGFRSGDSGRLWETEGSFKRGSTGTLRIGDARRDGSAIELKIEVTVDEPGRKAEFVAKVYDRGEILGVQRSSFELGRS